MCRTWFRCCAIDMKATCTLALVLLGVMPGSLALGAAQPGATPATAKPRVVLTHDPLVSEQVQRTILIRDGRTATETLRRRATGPEGAEQLVAEELAVLDRTGRLQLPPDYVAALTLERRVRLALERDHISVWPQHPRSEDGDGS